jgi:hypothetical protein
MNETTNSIKLTSEGYILVELVGVQDYLSMESVGKECKEIATRLHYEKKPVLGLIDFTRDTTFSPGTNKAAMQALEEINYDKAAMYGSNPVLLGVTKAMVAALGKSETTKVFSSKQEALAWLMIRDPLFGYGKKSS